MARASGVPEPGPIAAAVSGCKSSLVVVGLFSALMNVLLLTGPFFMLQVYDRVLTSRSIPTLIALSALAIGLYGFYGAFEWIRTRLLSRLARRFDRAIASHAFDFTTRGSKAAMPGDATRDLEEAQRFLGGPAMATLFDVPWFPFYLAVVYILHPQLGMLASVGAVAMLVIAVGTQQSAKRASAEANRFIAAETKLVHAGREQAETLAAMGMGGALRGLWQMHHDTRLAAQAKAADRQAIFASVSKTLRLIMQSAALGYGSFLVLENQLSAGSLIAASIIFTRALTPLDQAISQWRSIATAHGAFGRLRARSEAASAKSVATELLLPSKTLTVSDLSVTDPAGKRKLAQGVSFELNAGDALGIIGPSGSGKSSLVKGLIGILPTAAGEVRLDGATLDQWAQDRLGSIVGYLPQSFDLLPGTIAQNIARFDAGAMSVDVLEAAQVARVHELVVGFQSGFDTEVGLGGQALSGGERQRVGLARAVYGSPFLIVLDEPNASMDRSGDDALAMTIRKLREKGSIVIVVTHRNSVLGELNKLMLVEDGQQVLFGETADVMNQMRQRRTSRTAHSIRAGGLHVVG